VLSERCQRSREAISLDLDGMLSRFESLVLERHVRRCTGCAGFAATVRAQTELLRSAPLAEPRHVGLAIATRPFRSRRRPALPVAVALIAAAVLVLAPGAAKRSESTTASATGDHTLLGVVPGQPTSDPSWDMSRLRVVSPGLADGAVHGLYGLPVETGF
jgi:hypothetical protein